MNVGAGTLLQWHPLFVGVGSEVDTIRGDIAARGTTVFEHALSSCLKLVPLYASL